jgi:hypothetical protein
MFPHPESDALRIVVEIALAGTVNLLRLSGGTGMISSCTLDDRIGLASCSSHVTCVNVSQRVGAVRPGKIPDVGRLPEFGAHEKAGNRCTDERPLSRRCGGAQARIVLGCSRRRAAAQVPRS